MDDRQSLLRQLIKDERKAEEPLRGVLGRSTDGEVDASTETQQANSYYVQVEDAPDPRIAYIDPSIANLYALGNTAPVKLEYEDGKLMVRGVQGGYISDWYNSQTPSIYYRLAADDLVQVDAPIGSLITVLGGTGMNTTLSSTTFTVTLETPVVVANGGTGKTSVTSGRLLLGAGTSALTELAPSTSGFIVQSNGTTFVSAALNLTTNTTITGTLIHERGGLEADVSAYSGLIKISGGATSQAVAGTDYTSPTGTENLSNKTITASSLNSSPIGASSASTGKFTTLETTGAVIFNDAGADVDFRAEGDTDANLIFLDASTDRLGIGTATPSTKLDVNGNTTIRGAASTVRSLLLNTTTTTRWAVSVNDLSESGSNAGSDFIVSRYNDAGTKIDDALYIARNTGNATFVSNVVLGGDLEATGLVTGASGAFDTLTSGTAQFNPDANSEYKFSTAGVVTLEYANSNATGLTLNLYKARGNTSTESAVSSGDDLADINFQSYGDQQQTRVQIKAEATETHSATVGGSKLEIYTTANTTETLALAATFGQDKSLTVEGNLTADGATHTFGDGSTDVAVNVFPSNTGQAGVQIGNGRGGDGLAYLDFNAVTGVNYNARLIRAAGTNGTFQILHNGTGTFTIRNEGSAELSLDTNATARIRISGGGDIGFYGVAPVARPTWTTPTGTISRATFATSTVTLEQLAQRVYGIINDLEANGLFA